MSGETIYVSAGPNWLFCCEKCGAVRGVLHFRKCEWWAEGQIVRDDMCAYPVRPNNSIQHATYKPDPKATP
jgi:hypothetical protein